MPDLEAFLLDLSRWITDTGVTGFMQQQTTLVHVALETLHILGMAVLFGTVGVFDLRVLGFAASIPPHALHRLIPWGIAGFAINLATGSLFVAGNPQQYLLNPALQLKFALIILAGINLMGFYGFAAKGLAATQAGERAPITGRVFTAVSLASWLGVAVCGALVTSSYFG